mgnify:CR=1 FL=1
MSEEQDVVNVPVAVCHNGQHYEGVTIHDGVPDEYDDASTCLPAELAGNARLMVLFKNIECGDVAIFYDAIGAPDICKIPCGEYLQLIPAN